MTKLILSLHIIIYLYCFLGSTTSYAHACNDFLVVVDAGSSGSRAYLYQKSHNITPQNPILWTLISESQHEPGLHQITLNKVSDYIESLWHPLVSKVTNRNTYSNKLTKACVIPVQFLGTGGMRSLTPSKSQLVYQKVIQSIPKYFKIAEIRTLTGIQEAIYAWVAVNGMKHTSLAQTHNIPNNSMHNTDYKLSQLQPQTWAALDLGGATAQVSFASEQATHLLRWGTHHFHLYAQSLPWGQDRVRLHSAMTQACAVKEGPWPTLKRDKQMHVNMPLHSKDIHIHHRSIQHCQSSVESVLEALWKNSKINVSNLSSKTVDPSINTHIPSEPLFSQALLAIPSHQNIMATGVYAFHRMTLQLPTQSTFQQVKQQQEHLCALTWKQLQKISKTPPVYLFNVCLTSTLIRILLKQLQVEDTRQLSWVYKQYKQVISWPLGVALCHQNCMIKKL
jgi:hypothetical protein